LYDDTSDHYPVLIELCDADASVVCQPNEVYRIYDNSSMSKFSDQMASHNWFELVQLCEAETDSSYLYDSFFNEFITVYNFAFPLKIKIGGRKLKQSHPWMTFQLIKCCRKKSKLLKNIINWVHLRQGQILIPTEIF